MTRLLSTSVLLFCALLSLAVGTLWLRSYFVLDTLSGTPTETGGIKFCGRAVAGRLVLSWTSGWDKPRRDTPFDGISYCKKAPWTWETNTASEQTMFYADPARGYTPATDAPRRRWLGFEYTTGPYSASELYGYSPRLLSHCLVVIPLWVPTVLFGVLPGYRSARFVVQRIIRRRRTRAGRCLVCGYDLRASPDRAGPRLERCPECGREVAEDKGTRGQGDKETVKHADG